MAKGGPMKKSKFNESQIVAILKEGEAATASDVMAACVAVSHALAGANATRPDATIHH
jgi:hypothetical protein